MALFDRIVEFDAPLFRNIISLRKSEDLFDDLVPDAAGQRAALAADMHMRDGPCGVIERGLAYSEAIGYPFAPDPSVGSRYADGSIRAWYGALDEATATAETCWHQLAQVTGIEGVTGVVTRYRAVYGVHARGLMLDLRDKEAEHPELVGDSYAQTQGIGKRAAQEGLPGIVYPSARWPGGTCLVAFRAEPLSNPRLLYYLTYRIDADAKSVAIERNPGVVDYVLHVSELRRTA